MYVYMKFLIDNYTNNQTIIETKVKTEHSGILTQSQEQGDQSKISPMSTHNTTHPSNTATNSGQANARWYVSC